MNDDPNVPCGDTSANDPVDLAAGDAGTDGGVNSPSSEISSGNESSSSTWTIPEWNVHDWEDPGMPDNQDILEIFNQLSPGTQAFIEDGSFDDFGPNHGGDPFDGGFAKLSLSDQALKQQQTTPFQVASAHDEHESDEKTVIGEAPAAPDEDAVDSGKSCATTPMSSHESIFSNETGPTSKSSEPFSDFEEYHGHVVSDSEQRIDTYVAEGKLPLRCYRTFVGPCNHSMYQLYGSVMLNEIENIDICSHCGFNHGTENHEKPWYETEVIDMERKCDDCLREKKPLPAGWIRPCNRCLAVQHFRLHGVQVVRDRTYKPKFNPSADPLPFVGIWELPDDPNDDPYDLASWENGKIPMKFMLWPPYERYCCLNANSYSSAECNTTEPANPTWVHRVHDHSLPNPDGYHLLPNPIDHWGVPNAEANIIHQGELAAALMPPTHQESD